MISEYLHNPEFWAGYPIKNSNCYGVSAVGAKRSKGGTSWGNCRDFSSSVWWFQWNTSNSANCFGLPDWNRNQCSRKFDLISFVLIHYSIHLLTGNIVQIYGLVFTIVKQWSKLQGGWVVGCCDKEFIPRHGKGIQNKSKPFTSLQVNKQDIFKNWCLIFFKGSEAPPPVNSPAGAFHHGNCDWYCVKSRQRRLRWPTTSLTRSPQTIDGKILVHFGPLRLANNHTLTGDIIL